MKDLVIEAGVPKNRRRHHQPKGRSFRAHLLAYAEASALWQGGQTASDTVRPVWMMLAGTDNELRPFVANLQVGRKAESFARHYHRVDDRFEVLKSSGFHFAWQRTDRGSVVTAYLPELFRLDPGMVDPDGAAFCILPAESWITPLSPEARDHLLKVVGPMDPQDLDAVLDLAPMFIAYLDRRTRCPIIRDQRFYAQVLHASLRGGLATLSCDRGHSQEWGRHGRLGYVEYGLETVGVRPGLAFRSDHESLERLLSEQVRIYYDVC